MRADVIEKEKEVQSVVPEKISDPVVKVGKVLSQAVAAREKQLLAEMDAKYTMLYKQHEDFFAQKEKKLIDDLLDRHAVECRRLQEEASAAEKQLLVELEVKYDMIYQQLEESLSRKGKQQIDDLQSCFAAERCRLEQAAKDREQSLLDRLGVARRQLVFVVLAAVLSIAALFNSSLGSKDVPLVASIPVADPGKVPAPLVQELVPVSIAPVLPEVPPTVVAKTEPKPALAAPVITGNGGNFSRGSSRVK